MSGYNRRGAFLGDVDPYANLDPATAALYRAQAAAAAGAGRAAETAAAAASARGQIQEQAQAAVMEAAAEGRIYTRPNYLRIGLVFGGLGLGAYLLIRRKPKFRGHR